MKEETHILYRDLALLTVLLSTAATLRGDARLPAAKAQRVPLYAVHEITLSGPTFGPLDARVL